MKKSRSIISDITCMKEKFCIAGFDTYEKNAGNVGGLMVGIGMSIKFRPHITKYRSITEVSKNREIIPTEPKM